MSEEKEMTYRNLLRVKRDKTDYNHPCIKRGSVKQYVLADGRRIRTVSCWPSINTGCFGAIAKYHTPMCAPVHKYFPRTGEAVVVSCQCRP